MGFDFNWHTSAAEYSIDALWCQFMPFAGRRLTPPIGFMRNFA